MSQATLVLDGDVDQGPALISKLHDFRDALLTEHKGPTAPSYKVAGMSWLDDSGGTTWVKKKWDGAAWITELTYDTTAHTVSISASVAASAVSFTPTGGLASTDVAAALAELDSEKVSKAGDTLIGTLLINQSGASATATNFTNTNADAGGVTEKRTKDSASPAASDFMHVLEVWARDSGASLELFGQHRAQVTNATAGAEASLYEWLTRVAGAAPARAFAAGAGLMVGSGAADPGAGKINAASDVQVNAVSINSIGAHMIWVPAGAMTPRITNGPSPSTFETSSNDVMVLSLDFDPATDEAAHFPVAFPKSWNRGTVTARFFWYASNTGNVVWGLRGLSLSDDDPLDAAWGTAQTVTDGVTATTDLMVSSATAAVTLAGTPADFDLSMLEVGRNASNGSDTLAVDAKLIGVLLTYTTAAATDA